MIIRRENIMVTTIRHKSGKTWKCETKEDWFAFHNDPLYSEYDDDDDDFTFDGMSWSEYFKTVVLPEQMKHSKPMQGVFEDD
jgi:hypothetical protein